VTARIGMLTPSSNTVLEPATAVLAAPLAGRVSVHYSRFPVTRISDEPDSHQQFAVETMLAAARLLADARVHVITWNGTSGAWEGLDHDRELVARIEQETGIPATTATLTLVETMRSLGIENYALVVPYIDAIAERIQSVLGAEGFECVACSNERIADNFAFSEVGPERVAERAGSVAEGAQAIVIHCTNFRGAEVAAAVAEQLRMPVLDSVVVAFHGALQAVGVDAPLPGLTR
jgi:maleate isomerase